MTEWNCKRPNHSGRAIIRDQFIIWIEPGVVGEMRTMASPLRAGEILAGDRLDQIFGDFINALLQSDSCEGVETLEFL
jgi:hypothetical protein